MRAVKILTFYLQHTEGDVVEVRDQDAVLLVAQGRAEYTGDEPVKKPAQTMTTKKVVKK